MKQDDSSAKAALGAESGDNSRISLKRRPISWYKKLCPNCLSDLILADSISGWLTPAEYFCEKCGYRGPVAIEPVKDERVGDEAKKD